MAKKKKETKEKKPIVHLTYEDRTRIASMLNEKASVREIAKRLGKSPSTISKEIQRNKICVKDTTSCSNRRTCKHRNLCESCIKTTQCSRCPVCIKVCPDRKPIPCTKRLGLPLGLCNSCYRYRDCPQEKMKYDSKKAQQSTNIRQHNSKSGFDLTDEQIAKIDELVTPLIKKGLSPYAIKAILGDQIPCSESTLRRLIHSCELGARNIDLRDAVKRKPRKHYKRKMHNEIVSQSKIGHLWEDYLSLINTKDVSVVQMDCVEGKREESKVLLTLHFPVLHLQLAFIMKNHTSKSVVDTLDLLELSLGTELFSQVFEVILTDNGHEFTDISGMERSIHGGKRTSVYFCEPNRSDEKAECETNHKMIRYVIPKGTSLESLTQPDVLLMMNHINSYPRKSIMGASPYQMASSILPKKFFEILGLERIPYDEINLTPSLLKR